MSEPEHIAATLKRVLGELERKYKESAGTRSPDPCGSSALTTAPGVPLDPVRGEDEKEPEHRPLILNSPQR
jgi:hypothetical protein